MNSVRERLIGSIRRECLNHTVVFGERHLKWILKKYFVYYLDFRTHLSLEKDAPNPRLIQSPELRQIIQDAGSRWAPPSLRTSRCLTDERQGWRSVQNSLPPDLGSRRRPTTAD